MAYVGLPDMFVEADRVEISVSFTWDLPKAEQLLKEWKHIAPVCIGGPATGEAGGNFVPGQYVKRGYVITSRGCPNKCWFCSVWKREGDIRELPVTEGWNVLDDNILACSKSHFVAVCDMLMKQKHPIEFTGGMEAARLTDWHIELLRKVHPKQMFFAYDTPDDYEPLLDAGRRLQRAGFKYGDPLRAYVLIGHPRDTIEKAESRLFQTVDAGFMPMAMLYRDVEGKRDCQWQRFQRQWARPAAIKAIVRNRLRQPEIAARRLEQGVLF